MKSTTVVGILAAAVVGVFACTGPGITDVSRHESRAARLVQPQLITCPASGTVSTSGIISPLGGVLSVGGTTVTIPLGALLTSKNISVTVPASNKLEIDVSVAGTQHYTFQAPIIVTMSYARCNDPVLDTASLAVWYVDEDYSLLEPMLTVDNKLLKTVTFTTGHLSGYAVANVNPPDPDSLGTLRMSR